MQSASGIYLFQSSFHPVTGLVHIALEAKKYVLSVFGAQSAQYKQVSKIKFKIILRMNEKVFLKSEKLSHSPTCLQYRREKPLSQ